MMKLTEENADYMDCRPPPEGLVDLAMVPEHMRARMAKRREAKAAELSSGRQDTTAPIAQCAAADLAPRD